MATVAERKRLIGRKLTENLRYEMSYSTLADTISFLSNKEKELRSAGWTELRLSFDYQREYYDDISVEVKITGLYTENDEEYAARMESIKQRESARRKTLKENALKKEANEKAQYLRLKAKFGGG